MKPLIILVALTGVLAALHCDKEFNYYDDYGHGFDVTCQGITKEHLHLLQNITINNEISLKIDNSTLRNISSKIFQNIHNVRYVYIQNSTLTFAKTNSVFELLKKLEHLLIVNTNLNVNKFTFKGLENLQRLVLINNNLEEIEAESFGHLKKLKNLEISHNKLDDITDIPMCELKELRQLNLSKNFIYKLKKQVFLCRHSEDSMEVKLNNLPININKKDYISLTDYYLELTHFDLSYNKIREIDGSLNYLKFIKVLHLEGNKLSKLGNLDLNLLQDLERLNLYNNLLDCIEEKVFAGKENLEFLDVSYNKLSWLNLNNTPMLSYLNLANNKFNVHVLENITRTDSLNTLILSGNKFNEISPNTFSRFIFLDILDLSNNPLKLNEDSLNGLKELKSLSLKNSGIEFLPAKIFKSMKLLQILDLSGNKLNSITINETFSRLDKLEILNISYNSLETISYDSIKYLTNLHVLDISGNKLKAIQYDLIMSKLPSLSVLNIKSNLLSCEFLSKLIKYLKEKQVSYTSFEKFDYEKENIAGIYCSSETKSGSNNLRNKIPNESNALINISIAVLIVLVSIIISILLFKIFVYLKRRRYRADEFELIDE